MTFLKKIILGALFLTSTYSHAGFYTGNTLIKQLGAIERIEQQKGTDEDLFEAGQLMGYVSAVSDSLQRKGGVCYPAGVTIHQLVAIVGKEARQLPEYWASDGAVIVILAITAAFPCK